MALQLEIDPVDTTFKIIVDFGGAFKMCDLCAGWVSFLSGDGTKNFMKAYSFESVRPEFES